MADARITGSALADQYIAWVDRVLASWVTNNPTEVITSITSGTTDSPTAYSNNMSVLTATGRNYAFTESQQKGVISVTPPSATAPAAGGTGTCTVVTSPGAVWTATSDQAWLTATVAGAVVTWTAAANTDTVSRVGILRLGGETGQSVQFVVTQEAAVLTRR